MKILKYIVLAFGVFSLVLLIITIFFDRDHGSAPGFFIIFSLFVLLLLILKRLNKKAPILLMTLNSEKAFGERSAGNEHVENDSNPIPLICPVCKSPNAKSLEVCDYCGNPTI